MLEQVRLVPGRHLLRRCQLPPGHRDHPQPGRGQLLQHPCRRAEPVGRGGPVLSRHGAFRVRKQGTQGLEGSLDHEQPPAPCLDDPAGTEPLGGKGERAADPGQGLVQRFAAALQPAARHRHVERIAQELPGLTLPHRRGGERQVEQAAPSVRAQVPAAHRIGQAGEGQPVFSEGAGLVGADHVHRAQGLDRVQAGDEHVLPGHAQAAHGQRQGQGGQQPLGHVGHDDAHHEHQVDPQGPAADHAVQEEGDPHGAGDGGEDADHARHLALERRGGAADGLRQPGDAAETGAQPGGEHHPAAGAAHHRAAGKGEVGALLQGAILGRGIEAQRLRLAGERRGVDQQRVTRQDAHVGGDLVAFGEHKDVTDHHRLGLDLLHPAGAHHLHPVRQEAFERGHGPLGPVFLEKTEQGIEQRHHGQGPAEQSHALGRVDAVGDKAERP